MKMKKVPSPGDYVSNEEVAAYALPAHKPCNGSGFMRRDLGLLCECARARFLDSNIFRIWPDAEHDALRWGPNPPSADEMKEVARRSGEGWMQFQQLAKPDPIPEEPS